MILNILKRDMKRKKVMNFILFLFIILTSMFLSSSVNDLIVSNNAVDQFIAKANIPEFTILSMAEEGNDEQIEGWLSEHENVMNFHKEEQILIPTGSLKKENGEKYKISNPIVFTKNPLKYNIVFNMEDDPIELKSGEVAVPLIEGEENSLNIGDELKFTIGEVTKTFKIKCFVKDAFFGNSFMGFKQLFISDEDHKELYSNDETVILNLRFVESDNLEILEKDFFRQPFKTMAGITIEQVKMIYIMDMIIAIILIVVSICFICIAFFILRFTIVFTMQEDYKEIGIMKAIGMKNRGIKSIYIIKYFFLSVIGSFVGVALSFPFSNLLLADLKKYISTDKNSTYLWVNILSGFIIIILVVAFCFFSANKVNRFTAMEAIRGGSRGERFKRKNMIMLHKQSKMPSVVYLALNDIITNLKRYISLIATFIIGTILIILPLNAANTLSDESLITMFGFAKTDIFLTGSFEQYMAEDGEDDKLYMDMKKLENLYASEGIDVSLYAECNYNIIMYGEDQEESIKLLATQAKGFNTDNYAYIEGSPPKLNNEIAITEIAAKKIGVTIGDMVHITLGEKTKEYLITATYQSMMNLGMGVRFSDKVEINALRDGGVLIAGYFQDETEPKAGLEMIKKLSPEYEPKSGSMVLEGMMGSIINRVEGLKMLILIVVLFINCLITIMMVRMFIAKDIGEIAMLKSIGFQNRAIRIWQTLRISILLILSIIIGIILSFPLNDVLGAGTFGVMGASQIKLIIIPQEVYGIYPSVLLIGTTVAAFVSTVTINKVNFQEMNNIE